MIAKNTDRWGLRFFFLAMFCLFRRRSSSFSLPTSSVVVVGNGEGKEGGREGRLHVHRGLPSRPRPHGFAVVKEGALPPTLVSLA